MKKLFSLALVMVMLTSVFALVGCNGLWGFDDDDDVVAAPGINWNVKGDVDLSDVDGLNLRGATALTTDYSALEANVYRISDGVKMNDTAATIGSNGEFTVTFTGLVGSYSVKITHKTLPNFYLTRLINDTLNNNSVALVLGVVSTGIAEKYNSDPTLDFTQYDTLKTDTEVVAYAKALEKEYLTVVTTGEDADGISATPIVKVESVALNSTTKSLNKAETFQLTATLTPTTATVASVTWASSNSAVATVDANGLVTAVGGGVANITVTTVSGSKTAVCAVTVMVPVTGITLDKSTLTMDDGSTSTLVATVAPADATNKTVTWASSDTSVATVANGVVTSLKPGTVTITATAAGDTTKTATCLVTVNAVTVASVTLNKSTTSIVTGQTETLVATLVPANATVKTVTWTSSNAGVATVSNTGVVTAVAVGTANITVTTTDGSKTAVCAVTVVAAPIAVTGVTVAPTTASVAVGGKTTVVATVAPTNATNQTVSWASSNTSVATVDSGTGVVTGVTVGTANITVTTTDGSKTATCVVTVTAAAPAGQVTLSATVSGATTTGMQIKITGVDEAFTTTATLKDANGGDQLFQVETTISGLVAGIVLTDKTTNLLTIADFDKITFTTPVTTSGARISVTQGGTEKAFVVIP